MTAYSFRQPSRSYTVSRGTLPKVADKKKRRKKERANRNVSGPQFATHVFGGGYYLGPGNYGYSTAQNESGAEDTGSGGGEGDGGGGL